MKAFRYAAIAAVLLLTVSEAEADQNFGLQGRALAFRNGFVMGQVCRTFGPEQQYAFDGLLRAFQQQNPGVLSQSFLDQQAQMYQDQKWRQGGCPMSANEQAIITQWRAELDQTIVVERARLEQERARLEQQRREQQEVAERHRQAALIADARRAEVARSAETARAGAEADQRHRGRAETIMKSLAGRWARVIDSSLKCRTNSGNFVLNAEPSPYGRLSIDVPRGSNDGGVNIALKNVDFDVASKTLTLHGENRTLVFRQSTYRNWYSLTNSDEPALTTDMYFFCPLGDPAWASDDASTRVEDPRIIEGRVIAERQHAVQEALARRSDDKTIASAAHSVLRSAGRLFESAADQCGSTVRDAVTESQEWAQRVVWQNAAGLCANLAQSACQSAPPNSALSSNCGFLHKSLGLQ